MVEGEVRKLLDSVVVPRCTKFEAYSGDRLREWDHYRVFTGEAGEGEEGHDGMGGVEAQGHTRNFAIQKRSGGVKGKGRVTSLKEKVWAVFKKGFGRQREGWRRPRRQ